MWWGGRSVSPSTCPGGSPRRSAGPEGERWLAPRSTEPRDHLLAVAQDVVGRFHLRGQPCRAAHGYRDARDALPSESLDLGRLGGRRHRDLDGLRIASGRLRGAPHLVEQAGRGRPRGKVAVAEPPGAPGGGRRVTAHDDGDALLGWPGPAEDL